MCKNNKLCIIFIRIFVFQDYCDFNEEIQIMNMNMNILQIIRAII